MTQRINLNLFLHICYDSVSSKHIMQQFRHILFSFFSAFVKGRSCFKVRSALKKGQGKSYPVPFQI